MKLIYDYYAHYYVSMIDITLFHYKLMQTIPTKCLVSPISWGFTTETLVATYKAIVCPILNYAASIWFTQVSPKYLDKLEVIQNKPLRITTGCH